MGAGFAGKHPETMSAGEPRQVDENVDPVRYDLLGELIVGHAPGVDPFVGDALKTVRDANPAGLVHE